MVSPFVLLQQSLSSGSHGVAYGMSEAKPAAKMARSGVVCGVVVSVYLRLGTTATGV